MDDFDKKLYWERRKKGLRGQTGFVNMHITVNDEKGVKKSVPVGYKKGPFGRNASKDTSKAVDRRFTKKGFKNHKPGDHIIPPTYELSLTNQQRHAMRQLNRENRKQEAYVSKAGTGR